jgi:pilus assembly protein CpaC
MRKTMQKWVWVRTAGVAVLLIAVFGLSTIFAQGPAARAGGAAAAGAETDASAVRLRVGRSTVVDVGSPITRVSLTSADVADAMVTAPNQLLLNGKTPGTISMFVWDRAGALRRYEVTVERDLSRLNEQLKQLFPNEKFDTQTTGKNIVLAGTVSNKDVLEKAINVAAGYVSSRDEVVSLMQLAPGAPSNQVMLRVRFAEVSRSALTEMGVSFFTSPTGINNNIGRITTQQFSAPEYSDLNWSKVNSDFGSDVTSASGKINFGDFLNFFLFNQKYDLGAVVRLLQTRGLFQTLAEPNLVAESGKEASFLAGGEIPIPIAQGSGVTMAISVTYKEYGIRLNFTPTVTGDRVHLKVRPEVSTIDFTNAVVLNGFRIPALATRRTETELELQNGQSFAVAGLMNNSVRSSLQKVPGIGNIPILGLLFTSKAAQKDQTELVVMITPVILPNNSNGVTPNLPRTPEPYLGKLPEKQTIAPQPPAFGDARSLMAPVAVPAAAAPQPAKAGSANAAAAVSNLTPAGAKPAADPSGAKPANSPSGAKPASGQATQQKQSKADEKARQEDIKQQTAKILADRKKAEEDRAQQDKVAKEQQKRDAETAKKAGEDARKKADQDRDQQKSIDDAAAKLKAAEAAYNAELAKKGKQ